MDWTRLGFAGEPFATRSDRRNVYVDETRRQLLRQIMSELGHVAGFVVVTGEPGIGKTTLLHDLAERVVAHRGAYLLSSDTVLSCDTGVTLHAITESCSYVKCMARLSTAGGRDGPGADGGHADGAPFGAPGQQRGIAVVLLDDGDRLGPDLLRQVRRWRRAFQSVRGPMAIVLTARPESCADGNTAFDQELDRLMELPPFAEADREAFVRHGLHGDGDPRSEVADRLLTAAALQRIVFHGTGNPQKMARLCREAMALAEGEAFPLQPDRIDEAARYLLTVHGDQSFAVTAGPPQRPRIASGAAADPATPSFDHVLANARTAARRWDRNAHGKTATGAGAGAGARESAGAGAPWPSRLRLARLPEDAWREDDWIEGTWTDRDWPAMGDLEIPEPSLADSADGAHSLRTPPSWQVHTGRGRTAVRMISGTITVVMAVSVAAAYLVETGHVQVPQYEAFRQRMASGLTAAVSLFTPERPGAGRQDDDYGAAKGNQPVFPPGHDPYAPGEGGHPATGLDLQTDAGLPRAVAALGMPPGDRAPGPAVGDGRVGHLQALVPQVRALGQAGTSLTAEERTTAPATAAADADADADMTVAGSDGSRQPGEPAGGEPGDTIVEGTADAGEFAPTEPDRGEDRHDRSLDEHEERRAEDPVVQPGAGSEEGSDAMPSSPSAPATMPTAQRDEAEPGSDSGASVGDNAMGVADPPPPHARPVSRFEAAEWDVAPSGPAPDANRVQPSGMPSDAEAATDETGAGTAGSSDEPATATSTAPMEGSDQADAEAGSSEAIQADRHEPATDESTTGGSALAGAPVAEDDGNTAVSETAEEDGEAQDAVAAETEDPEPKAPETKTPETKTPETSAVETKAADTQAPEAADLEAADLEAADLEAADLEAAEPEAVEAGKSHGAEPPAEATEEAGLAAGEDDAAASPTDEAEASATAAETEGSQADVGTTPDAGSTDAGMSPSETGTADLDHEMSGGGESEASAEPTVGAPAEESIQAKEAAGAEESTHTEDSTSAEENIEVEDSTHTEDSNRAEGSAQAQGSADAEGSAQAQGSADAEDSVQAQNDPHPEVVEPGAMETAAGAPEAGETGTAAKPEPTQEPTQESTQPTAPPSGREEPAAGSEIATTDDIQQADEDVRAPSVSEPGLEQPAEAGEIATQPTALEPAATAPTALDPTTTGSSAPETTVTDPRADPEAEGPDVSLLLDRGDGFLELGDVASARLFYRLAASRGSAEAAMLMGLTYDPLYFRKMGIQGTRPSSEHATTWYRKAMALGSRAAEERSAALESWLGRPQDESAEPGERRQRTR